MCIVNDDEWDVGSMEYGASIAFSEEFDSGTFHSGERSERTLPERETFTLHLSDSRGSKQRVETALKSCLTPRCTLISTNGTSD